MTQPRLVPQLVGALAAYATGLRDVVREPGGSVSARAR